MKITLRKITLVLVSLMMLSLPLWAKSERQTVVFDVDIHCQNCIRKIEKNIAFEKGVKDLICDLKNKQVTVVFDPQKTNVEALQKAFSGIGKTATEHIPEDLPAALPAAGGTKD